MLGTRGTRDKWDTLQIDVIQIELTTHMNTNMYKHISVHIIIYTSIHMVYIKSSESKGTLVLSIERKLGRMESLTV